MMPSAIVCAVYALAVARVTTLLTHDEITAPARSWIVKRFDSSRRWHRLVAYLLGAPEDDISGCPWCMSVWVGLALASVVWAGAGRGWVMAPLLGLAASQITGMIYIYGRQ